MEEKSNHKFIVFNTKDFYPSIKEAIRIKTADFAKKRVNVTNGYIVIIKHARKFILCDNNEPLMKKESSLSDVTIGAYDGAQVCKMGGTFFLCEISQKYNKNNIGLYQDDGLAIFKNIRAQNQRKLKKIFKNSLKKVD